MTFYINILYEIREHLSKCACLINKINLGGSTRIFYVALIVYDYNFEEIYQDRIKFEKCSV